MLVGQQGYLIKPGTKLLLQFDSRKCNPYAQEREAYIQITTSTQLCLYANI